jgi:hypothetical protein
MKSFLNFIFKGMFIMSLIGVLAMVIENNSLQGYLTSLLAVLVTGVLTFVTDPNN